MVHAVVYRGGNTLVNGCLRGATSPFVLDNSLWGSDSPARVVQSLFCDMGAPEGCFGCGVRPIVQIRPAGA